MIYLFAFIVGVAVGVVGLIITALLFLIREENKHEKKGWKKSKEGGYEGRL